MKPTSISPTSSIDRIIQTFQSWKFLSGSKDFAAMHALVLPKSDFDELTQAFQKSHQTGIHYSNAFENLERVNVSDNKKEATIRGTIIMKMMAGDINYIGKFISSCIRKNPSAEWKLNEIKIEWK